MADTLLTQEFWLPPKFFADEEEETNFSSPFDFPSNLGSSLSSSAFSSPVESLLGSIETESDEEDDSVTESTRPFNRFTHQSQKSWSMARVKMNGGDNVLDAAVDGQVNRVEMNGGDNVLDAAVDGQVNRVEMNGGYEWAFKGRWNVGRTMEPTYGQHYSPLWHNMSSSFYWHQFPSTFGPEPRDQILNQNNCCSILGRPSVDNIQKLQLQQQILFLNRSNVIGLPQYTGQSTLIQHQINQIRGAYLGKVGPKQTCAGTGVFIPRPHPSYAPNKPVAGRSTAHLPPRAYHAVNKNSNLISTQALAPPIHDTFSVRSKTIPIQKMLRLELDGLENHGPSLPQEWSY